MDLAELQRRVDRYVKLDLTPHYAAYAARGGRDIDGFIAFLGNAGVVDGSVLKELYGMTDVEVPTMRHPAYAGTLLAAWTASAERGPTWAGQATAAVGGTAGATGASATGGPTVADPTGAPAAGGGQGPAGEVRFQPISKLGQGAMGAIHVARDLYLRRKVALKSVLPEMARHAQLLDRFLSEMQITAQLEHPNIVPVYALEIGADGSLGYAMKLVQGRDLEQVLDEARKMVGTGQALDEDHKLEKRLEYFLKVCDAVEFAHSKGIVHRDLKPANVMIGRHNEVYLMDWGIARPMGAGGQAVEAGIEIDRADAAKSPDLSRTRVGSAIGTPYYMSPEQAEGKNAELDGRSDLYTLGLILQECVSLKRAVDGTTLQEVLTKAKEARRDPVEVGVGQGRVPREIEAVVRKATRRAPQERYLSVRALADDVRRYLRGETVEALPEGPLRRAGRWLSKHRTSTLAIILGLGLVGSVGTIGALVAGQARMDAAHARELRVSQMQTESAIQAQLVDRELSLYEAALDEFVGAARTVLGEPPEGGAAPYFDEQFAAKETAPPDLGPSKRYGRDVSVLAPVVTPAPGVAREPIDPLLRSLGRLTPAFRALMIDSAGEDWRVMTAAQQRAAIADQGVPAFRATLGLREGVTLSFPGMGGQAPTDPREAAYFKAAAGKHGVVWGTPATAENGSVLPASAAIYDEAGTFRGVALLEVSLDRLLARSSPAEMDYVQSRQLVGRDGKVMAEENKAEGRVPLAPEVTAAIAAGKSGHVVAVVEGRSWQYAYYPLATLDWYYVAAGETKRMLASKTKMLTSDPRKLIRASIPAPPAAAPAPPAPAPVAPPAEVDAGDDAGDAGDDAGDAGDDASAPVDAGNDATAPVDAGAPIDAGIPPWRAKAKPGPMPKGPGEQNPFGNWKVYEKKGGK